MSTVKYLSKLDLFGVNFEFKINGRTQFKSVFGGILSIILTVTVSLFVIFNFRVMMNRQYLKLNNYREIPLVPQFNSINDTNSFLAFDLIDNNRNSLFNNESLMEYLDFKIIYSGLKAEVDLKLYPCKNSLHKSLFLPNNYARHISKTLCLDFNNSKLGVHILK